MCLSNFENESPQTTAGLWSCSLYLGGFLGPLVGGFLVEYFGFGQSAWIFAILFMFAGLMDVTELVTKIVPRKGSLNYSSLSSEEED